MTDGNRLACAPTACPSTNPSARRDSTGAQHDGQQAPARHRARAALPSRGDDTPSTLAPAQRLEEEKPTPPPSVSQHAHPDQPGEARHPGGKKRSKTDRTGREEKRRNEYLRPFSCRFSSQVIIKSNPAPGTPRRAPRRPGTPATVVVVSVAARLSPTRFNSAFGEFAELPARFRPSAVERTTTAPRPPARHRYRGSLHIFAVVRISDELLSTYTLSRT